MQQYLESMFGLSGSVALVTGASSGLGEHFARTLARAGAVVVLAARREEKLAALAAELRDAGATAYVVAMDVTSPTSVAAAVASAIEQAGKIDILINNAGVSTVKPFLEQTEEDWEFVVGTNLDGAWRVGRAVCARMAAQGSGGAVVNIASLAGMSTGGSFSAYSVAKAGLIHMTKCMALELARHKIRVNALAPGYFITPMNDAFLTSELGERIRKTVPTRRFGELKDLDAPLLLLVGPGGHHITGDVLVVDGGHLVKPL